MSYTALYRKFRPLKFEDMVGQEHITKTLKNQIISGRIGHAYLFNGGRGTGKTTSAKILARAVNCLNPKDGEPCNECEICKEILEGSLTDVVEMDAASNNSVDDIRSIRDEVNFLPTKAKYRVYIIDEVHMLSVGAFNALLKTLEEPPEHVKFILATTEPQKLPTTILSRCQRFDFKKIKDVDIIRRLKIICTEDNINVSEDAYKLIATLSEGAMRDAISILERCSQEGTQEINVSDIKELVGLPSLEYINKLAKAIIDKDEIVALQILDEVIDSGKDLYNFIWEVIKYFKDILVMKVANELTLYSKEELEDIKKLADVSEKNELLHIIYELSSVQNDIKWSSQKSIMVQIAIIKLCMNIANCGTDIEKRLELLESKLNNLKKAPIIESKSEIEPIKTETKREEKSLRQEPVQRKEPIGVGEANKEWPKILDILKKDGKIRLYTALINTGINEIGDDIWEIEFKNGLTSFNEKILQDPINQRDLQNEIFKATGKEINIKYKDTKNKQSTKVEKGSPIKDLGLDVNIIE